MQPTNEQLLGRVMVLELLLPIALTRIAELSDDPAAFIRGFMANAQAMIERAAAAAAPDELEAAQHALDSFEHLSDAIAEHLAQRSRPSGRA